MMENLPQHIVYQPKCIEFVTSAAQFCRLLENVAVISARDFVVQLRRVLPLLCVTAENMPTMNADGEFLEQFVFEDDYNMVRDAISDILAEQDSFLDSFHPDMKYSEAPILATISEYLADTYQELKDMAGNYQTADEEIMLAALSSCIENYREHWGRKVMSAMCALNAVDLEQIDNVDTMRNYDKEGDGVKDTSFDNLFDYNR